MPYKKKFYKKSRIKKNIIKNSVIKKLLIRQMELDADLDSNPAYKVCGFETTVIKNYFKFFFLSCYIELIKRKLITVILVLYYSL